MIYLFERESEALRIETRYIKASKTYQIIWRRADGTTTHRNTPTRVDNTTTWTANIAAGYHNCAFRTDGGLWCLGNNASGQLGDGTTTQRAVPQQVSLAG